MKYIPFGHEKREFRVGEQFIYPHEFAVLDPDGYFLRFSEQNNITVEKK